VDHLLNTSNGNGGGVEGCPAISDEQKDAVQRDYDKSKEEKGRKEMKRQQIQREIGMSSSPMNSSFTSKFNGSSSTQTKSCGPSTLNAFWKPLKKQQVDDAIVEFFYACAIPFNVAINPYFKKAFKKVVAFGKGYVPPGSEALRTTLLKKTKDRVTKRLANVKQSWKYTGCTILSDGWSDLCHRPLINVLVYCSQGVFFLRQLIQWIE
jgi:hypothetical protein